MKKNIFEEFSKIGEKLVDELAKGIEAGAGKGNENPFENMFSEIKNDQMKQVYGYYKTIGEFLFNLKEGLVAAGFSEEQAMDIVIQEYLEQRAESKE